MRAQLIPLDGGAPIEIVKDMTLVGRREDVDLRLEHKSVSKLHCVIVKTDGLLLIRDLGSTNGTRVNGQRVRRAALLPNDQVNIASYRFKVFLGPGESPAPPPQVADGATQQMDAREVANLLRRAAAQQEAAKDSSAGPVVPNKLPDVYPDDKDKKHKD
jgi:predicted component of type VI protein secretion system